MRTPPTKGDRVRLVGELEDPAPLPVGSEGVVDHVFEHEGWFQVSVVWEESVASRKLMLLDVDPYEVVN
jgi:hypothetical protein